MSHHHLIGQPDAGDLPELADLWEASVRATHDFLTEEDILFFKPLVLGQCLGMTELYCTRKAGRITGFVGISGQEIAMLFIAPEHRGEGIGRQLLLFAREHRQVNAVDVNEQNIQAIGFYLHMGFTISGRSETDSTGKPFPLLHLRLA